MYVYVTGNADIKVKNFQPAFFHALNQYSGKHTCAHLNTEVSYVDAYL